MSDRFLPKNLLSRSLHLSPRYNVAYINNPKVACSSIKLTLQRAELGDPSYSPPRTVHDRKTSPLRTWPDIPKGDGPALQELEGQFTFTFVRNPFSRLRSAYLNKIVPAQKSGRPREHAGFPADHCPDFPAFISAVCSHPQYRDNPHWREQVINLSSHRIRFDFIGHLEHFDRDWAQLSNWTGLPRRASFAGKRTKPQDKADLQFTPAMIDAVLDAYGDDFSTFGYSPDPDVAEPA